jgi:pimeloyl-ACP methyl ester carboxylesterase
LTGAQRFGYLSNNDKKETVMSDERLGSWLSRRRALAVLAASGAVGAAGCNSTPDVLAADQNPDLAATFDPVRFASRDAEIAGEIHLPAGTPTAGIVFVHGSGPAPRLTDLGRIMAADGFAVLTYDKRGVGESGGTYEGTYNISWDNLHLLAADAAAAIDTLASHPRLRGRPVGLFGFSQAGWIIPIAAVENRRVAFIAFWSGPVCRVSDELEYGIASQENMAAEDAARATEGSPAQMVELTKRYVTQIRADGTDVDPRTSLRQLDIPGLWLFGGADNEIPTELSVRLLGELISEGKPNFEQQTLPVAQHAIRNAFQEAYGITRDWIRAHTEA